MNIKTINDPPPIPLRRFDWLAYDAESYAPGCPVGFGATEKEAIEDLLSLLD